MRTRFNKRKVECKPGKGRLCLHEDIACCSLSRHSLLCTREKGHTGPHIACGIGKHNITTWYTNEN